MQQVFAPKREKPTIGLKRRKHGTKKRKSQDGKWEDDEVKNQSRKEDDEYKSLKNTDIQGSSLTTI